MYIWFCFCSALRGMWALQAVVESVVILDVAVEKLSGDPMPHSADVKLFVPYV